MNCQSRSEPGRTPHMSVQIDSSPDQNCVQSIKKYPIKTRHNPNILQTVTALLIWSQYLFSPAKMVSRTMTAVNVGQVRTV